MKWIIYMLSASSLFAQLDYRKTVIVDPSISRRCKDLLNKRQKKIKHKQKLLELSERNRKVTAATPPVRVSIHKKLSKNLRSLKNELKITELEIINQEENIIRKGCPGISL